MFCLLAGWGGVVLAVFLCRRMMFSDVGVIRNETGDISTCGRVRTQLISKKSGGFDPNRVRDYWWPRNL